MRPDPAPKRNIVVVDGNPDAGRLLAVSLGRRGHEVQTAHDAESAIAAVRDLRPHVVFIDAGVRDLAYLTRRLRRESASETLIVVAMRGEAARQQPDKHDEGVDVYLAKPVDEHFIDGFLGST